MSHLVFRKITKIAKKRLGKKISNCPYVPPLQHRQKQIAKYMAEGEGVGAGSGVPQEPCCDAGNSSERCVHKDAPRFFQQEDLIHIEYGSYHIGGSIRRPFQAC